jgi:hypothetical protein
MATGQLRSQHGQVLALFALVLTGLVLAAAVVVDGGFAFAQRRETQNAADFAAMAGTRIVGMAKTGRPAGTAANVRGAITSTLAANDAELASAEYVDASGDALGDVFQVASIPSLAFGVVVKARSDWRPFLLGVVGVTEWATNAQATARTTGDSLGGGVLPVGINADAFNRLPGCPPDNLEQCAKDSTNLTSGRLNGPGNFGWLSFGLDGNGGKCDWDVSLGMIADGGCQMNQPFLQSQIWPEPDSHGCCQQVGHPPDSVDLISGLTGNEWGDLSHYIGPPIIPVWVPIWDYAGSQGANAYYHIVGFGPIMFVDSGQGNNQHAKWLQGAMVETDCIRDGVDYSVPAPPGSDVEPKYCSAPLGEFVHGASGEVILVR